MDADPREFSLMSVCARHGGSALMKKTGLRTKKMQCRVLFQGGGESRRWSPTRATKQKVLVLLLLLLLSCFHFVLSCSHTAGVACTVAPVMLSLTYWWAQPSRTRARAEERRGLFVT
jgi:hypothetical protein